MIGGICGDGDVALFCEVLGIQASHLFLDAAVGMCNDDCRILLRGIVVGWRVDIGHNVQAIELVRHRMDIDLSNFVF
ncbi:hypothetical protein D3C71_1658700 [compost metagenome]